MATGDDASAAGMDVLTGNEPANTIDTLINATRDYIAQFAASVRSIAAGGTGASDAATARMNLDVVGNDQVVIADGTKTLANNIPRYDGEGHIACANPAAANHAASRAYVDNKIAALPEPSAQANGPTSTAYNRAATGSGWFAVYMNSSLQFMRNTSSIRYKENVRDWAGSVLGLRTVIFDRLGDDTPKNEVGFIAEEVNEVLPDAVMYFDDQIDGINDRTLLVAAIATIQQLNERLEALEARR